MSASHTDNTNNMHTDHTNTNTPSQHTQQTQPIDTAGERNTNMTANPAQEPQVFFRAVSWLRDSHGLFDYESRNIVKMSLKTQSQGQIIRNDDQIDFAKPDHVIDPEQHPNGRSLCQLKKDNEGYYLDHAIGTEDQEEESVDRLWLVARSLKNEQGKYDYKIQKFDAIKLGRVRFRVKDFRCDKIHLSDDELYNQELREALEVKGTKECEDASQDQVQCRICWGNEDDEENPLILACKCKGSVGLIHFDCLKSWVLAQKQEKPPSAQNQNVRSFYWKRFECEICKQMYPYTFKIGQKIYKIIDLINEITSQTQSNYILLESMPLDKNTSRNIHLLSVTNEQTQFKLGRGHESQVRINDISVSRCHAIIKCKHDGFYIEDNTSKFGTIILLKNKLRLKAHHTMAVQVGRTVISFTIKYVQSEREKIKSDINKVLDAKNKTIKGAIKAGPGQIGGPAIAGGANQALNAGNIYNQNQPLHMQQTQYAQQINMPMDAGEGDEGVDDGEDENEDEPRQMDLNHD